MKFGILAVSALSLGFAAAVLPASATQLLYSNGATNDGLDATTINYGFSVTDSFTLSQNATITGADFDLWLNPGDTLSTVDYEITTAPLGGSILGSGTESAIATYKATAFGYYPVETESISITNLDLSAGTYYLQLLNAVTSNGEPAYWDQNNGPSIAYQTGPEGTYNLNEYFQSGTGSNTFNIYGDSSSNLAATPEPSSFLMLGSGLLGFAGMLRRKLKA